MKKLSVIVAALALALVSFTGCDAETEKSIERLEKSTTNNPKLNAQINAIPIGTSRDEVEAQLGRPEDQQVMHSSYGNSAFLYYGEWQLSFENNELEGKSKF